MKKAFTAGMAAVAAMSCALTPVAASAQSRYYDSDRDGRSDYREWNRDRDRDGRPDQYDRYDNRRDGYNNRRDRSRYHDGDRRWRYYGGSYGYDGYRGAWRTGQRFPYYNNERYVIRDYRAYDLPPPRRGYRYYRDSNGDVVMAAIAGGVIGLIIGGAIGNDHHRRW